MSGLKVNWLRAPRALFVLAALHLVLAVPFAAARANAGPLSVAAAMPSSADLVIVAERAAMLRRTTAGRAVQHALAELGLTANLDAAWPDLATELRLDAMEAFDELLGRRFVLVVRELPDGGSEWAAACDVRDEIEARLRQNLRPAARGFVLNHPVFAVEGGRHEIVSIAAGAGLPGTRTIVLGEVGRSELVEAVVRGLTGGAPGALGETPQFTRIGRVAPGRSDLVVLERSGEGLGAFSAAIEQNEIHVSFVHPAGALFPAGEVPLLPEWIKALLGNEGEYIAGSLVEPGHGDPFGGVIIDVLRAAVESVPRSLSARMGPRFLLHAGVDGSLSLAAELDGAQGTIDEADAFLAASLGDEAPRLQGAARDAVRVAFVPAAGAVKFGPLERAPGILAWAFSAPGPRGTCWWLVRASAGARPEVQAEKVAQLAGAAAADTPSRLAFAARLEPALARSLMGLSEQTREALRGFGVVHCRAELVSDALGGFVKGTLRIEVRTEVP